MPNPKTVLITGANKGIGFEIASQLGKRGYYILLGARNRQRGQTAFHQLQEEGVQGAFIQMDVSDPSSITAAFGHVSNEVESLDVLINNAGILLDEGKPLLTTTDTATSLQTLQTNALGPLWICQRFLPLLHRGSRIIMISSSAGAFCEGVSSYAPVYGISKTAMNAVTRHLYRELQPKGVIINAMCPGWVRTDMGGPGANRSLEQGAETAVWLAGEAPESINGKFLRDKKEISW